MFLPVDPFQKYMSSSSYCPIHPISPLFGHILWVCIWHEGCVTVWSELCSAPVKNKCCVSGLDLNLMTHSVPKKWRPPALLDWILKRVYCTGSNTSWHESTASVSATTTAFVCPMSTCVWLHRAFVALICNQLCPHT